MIDGLGVKMRVTAGVRVDVKNRGANAPTAGTPNSMAAPAQLEVSR